MSRGDWAQGQVERVHGPIYAARALKARREKRRAMFSNRAEYSGKRNWCRCDARALITIIKLEREMG